MDMTPEPALTLARELARQGRLGEAAAALERRAGSPPDRWEIRVELANYLAALGRHREAIRQTELALGLDARCAPALHSQAASLLAVGDARAAIECWRTLARLTPGDAGVHNNLGIALAAGRQFDEALIAYGRALELKPDYARALNNRAAALMNRQRFAAALADLERALALEPRYTRALLNRGAAQRALGQHEAALASYRSAFPDPEALGHATDILMRDLHRGAEALACATELYRLAPERDLVAGTYHAAGLAMASWADHTDCSARIVRGVRAGRRPVTPFGFLYVTDAPEDQLACARRAAREFASRPALWRGEVYPHARLRVAYLSSDFHAHATAYLTAGLFEHHDRRQFECHALSYGKCPADDMRARIEKAFEHFENVDHLGTLQIAERIRELEIDILVDLKGYTGGSRIEVLSHRPAPVQVHYLGYPGTLGAPFVDYLIADHEVVPVADASYYTEQIVRLPHTYQATDDRRAVDGGAWTRGSAGLPAGGLVFAAFHQIFKLNPAVFDVWMRLLHRVPDSTLWLLTQDVDTQRNLTAEATARGIRPNRLVFAPRTSQAGHLARLKLADLLLDTWPYNAHTTASDALWAGVPMVALRGRSFAARVSSSILQAAGLSDLVAASLEDYERLLLGLCGAPGRLEALRQRIAATVRESPLFDTAGFTRALEECYRRMAVRYRAGQPPAPIGVTAD
jgi:predicted O-linked N-acetylglucosamine transferase (SPINDLY family)